MNACDGKNLFERVISFSLPSGFHLVLLINWLQVAVFFRCGPCGDWVTHSVSISIYRQ